MMMHKEDQVSELKLTVNDIVSYLQEFMPDQEVTREHLTNPTGPWVQNAYFKILLEFGFSEKMLDSHVMLPSESRVAEHAEIFQQIMPVYKLLAAFRLLLDSVNHKEVPDFGLMDLTEPCPKRTRRILASMVNFWQFSNMHFATVEGVQARANAKVQENQQLRNDIRHLNEKIEKIRMSNAEDGIKERNVNGQIQEMETEMAKWVKDMEGEEQRLEDVKSSLVTGKANEDRLEAEVNEFTRNEEDLKLVLRSVDLNKELESQLEQMKDERDSKVSSEKGDLDKKIDKLEEKIKELKSLMENMENFGKLRKQVKSKTSDQRAKEREMEVIKADVDSIESRILLWKKKNGDLIHQKASLLSKAKKRAESKEAELKAYQTEFHNVKKGLSEEEVVATELKSRVNITRRDLQLLDQESEQQKLAFEQEYARLLAVIKENFEEIDSDMVTIQDAFNEL